MIRFDVNIESVIGELRVIDALLQALGGEGAFVKLMVFTGDTDLGLRGIAAEDTLALNRLRHSVDREKGRPIGFLGRDGRGRLVAKPLAACEAIEEVRDIMKQCLEVSRDNDIQNGHQPGPIQSTPGGWLRYDVDQKEGA